MAEQLGTLGYGAFIKQTSPSTVLTPTDFFYVYDESLKTDGNFVEQAPIYGNKFATLNTLQGFRAHKGDITVVCEPNTVARFVDMFMTKSSTTGSGPYTHHYVFSNTTDPNSYVIDISTNNIVKRFWGVQASKITPNWNGNEMQLKISVSALGSFQTRVISTITGSGPYTVTLDTAYDPNPTTGLVTGDLIRFFDVSAAGTGAQYIDATVTAVTNGTSFTTSTNVSIITTGDSVHLRPASPSYNTLPTFLAAKTYWGFGASASAALTNATATGQYRVEKESSFELDHKFESDDGAVRFGGFDPAVLVRTTADANLTIKKAFDNPSDLNAFNQLTKQACVIRHTSGTTGQYELRLTYNRLTYDEAGGAIKAGSITYATIKPHASYDTTDAQAFALDIINGLSTI